MKLRDVILVTVLSLGSGWLILQATLTAKHTTKVEKVAFVDTTKLQDTIHSVKGKKVLFIGDSHTAFDFGWQHQVATKTGMSYLNTAVGGKQTTWMLETTKQNINSGFDYCFIYGGANDMAGNRAPIKAVRNIQRIVDLCKIHNVKAVVVTGFDPLTCVKVGSRKAYREYPQRYARFQQLLIDSIHGAEVIKTHCISRTDCGDFLCHMTASGHKKMAAKIISDLNFAVLK
jgi:lysophospholipase L1-like esterase